MEESYNWLKKIIIAGLLPLLVSTSGLIPALIFTFSLIFISLVVRLAFIITEQKLDEYSQWFLLWGVGISVSNFLYILLPELFPAISGYISFYYLLLGVTPLVYMDCKKGKWLEFFNNIILFLCIMILVSSMREIIGQGNLLGYRILNNPVLEILQESSGALIIIGISGITIEKIFKKLNLMKNQQKGYIKKENKRGINS